MMTKRSTKPTAPAVFTVGGAARVLGLSESRVRQLVDAEKLSALRASDGSRLILAASLEAYRK